MVAAKLLLDDKIPACVKQICLLGITCKVSKRKTLSGETFCFLEKRLLSVFKFCASSNLLFLLRAADWPTTNFFWNVLLFSCNLIGQLCLSGLGYCGRTVSQPTLTPAVQDLLHSLRAPMIVTCLLSFIHNILRSHQ